MKIIIHILVFLLIGQNLLYSQINNESRNMNEVHFNFAVSDSSKISDVVYKDDKGFVAVDLNGNELFTIFPFDNGPDYISEGMLRIIENNLIGFANELGEIVIEPQFSAVYPFHNGLAAFCNGCMIIKEDEHERWLGGKWGFIDQNGDVIIPDQYDCIIGDFEEGYATVEKDGVVLTINKEGKQIEVDHMNYKEWIRLLGEALLLSNKTKSDEAIKINLEWISHIEDFSFNKDISILQLDIILKHSEKFLARYFIIPWQNFSIKSLDSNQVFQPTLSRIHTVTDYAVIYISHPSAKLSADEKNLFDQFNAEFNRLINYENLQSPVEEEINIPDEVRVISCDVFEYYVDLQVAIPGSCMPENEAWEYISTNKMLRLALIPDKGPIKTSWIKQKESFTDTYYSSVENELQTLFGDAIEKAIQSPEERENIFKTTQNNIRGLFTATNSYVNYLFYKYENLLKRWLQLTEYETVFPSMENLFPDYEPKRTPDTMLDYLPSLIGEFAAIPDATIENLNALVILFNKYQNEFTQNPGHWEDGNMVLGARPREYKPSAPELLLSEVGERLQTVIDSLTKDKMQQLMQSENIKLESLEYPRFTFTHADVMGSGRFFYVDSIKKVKLDFRE